MATGGGAPEEVNSDLDLPNWSHESLEDRLNNLSWSGQKKANRSSEKNKKRFGAECETRLTNSISPESTPGVGRRRTRTPHTFPHTRYVSQMSVPEQAELERLKQKINFGDLDQQSIGSDSQGRVTAANNKRQIGEARKPFNFLPLQLNTNKEKASPSLSPPKKESSASTLPKDFLTIAPNKDFARNYQASVEEDGEEEAAIDRSQVVSSLVKIREYIIKASSLRDDLVEKKERSTNVEQLSKLIDLLKVQENSYFTFLQKMLGSGNAEERRTVESAVGSGSVAESSFLNIDGQSEASDATAVDPQQEAKEELKNMKKQHALLTRMLQQQEQLRALKGRQAALLALQHKAEQAIAVMDESVITETTGSVSGVSLTSELNEELNDLIQRFHNQLHDAQGPPVPDNRRQAESLSLAREVARSRNSSLSEPLSDVQDPLFNKVGVLLEKKQKMDSLLGELHDNHLNNTTFMASGSPHRSMDQRSIGSAASVPLISENRAANSTAVYPSASVASLNESDDEENQNPAEKLIKLKEVRKRLNELRDLVHYYEQTSDMMADAVNENTKEEDEEESRDSEYDSDSEQDEVQPVTNIRNPHRTSNWGQMNSVASAQCAANNRDDRPLNTECEINNRSAVNSRTFNVPSALGCLYNREAIGKDRDCDPDVDEDDAQEDRASRATVSSNSSAADDSNTDFEQKFNRLIAAKQKLRKLQDLVAMYGDDTESDSVPAESSVKGQRSSGAENSQQQPNNTRPNMSAVQKDVALKEQAREKFYESKLKQQQKELKQLQDERKKLIEIQEKIQTLRKACPDLQLSTSSLGTCPANRHLTTTASTPDVLESSNAVVPPMPDPEDSSSVDNEVWSEIRRHQIVREDLRQRRKQLESLMAEQQRRHGLTDTNSAASLRSDDSEGQGFNQQSKTEKTMATWGGSTQCALDEEEEEGDRAYISDGNQAEEEEEDEEEEEQDTFCENVSYRRNGTNQTSNSGNRSKNGWKSQRPFSVDGNYRPSPKTRQQQNISMRRQENLRWVSELSHVEEKEHWQDQFDQLKKQLDFSTNICQTLMRDHQTLSCMMQGLLVNPYNVMPGAVGGPQLHLLTHQLNQCYSQLNWQQNNVLRLKQMLNDVMRHQQEHLSQESNPRKDRGSSVPPPPSPNMFANFSFIPPPMNFFNMPAFGSVPNVVPGMNFNSIFPPGFGDFTHGVPSQSDTPLHPPDPNTSGKTEYMAFPKPFESSSSSNPADKPRNAQKSVGEGDHTRVFWPQDQNNDQGKKSTFLNAGHSASGPSMKQSEETHRVKQFDEESMESLSSMPDPVDSVTFTKTFRARKAVAQASLASKDKTPKAKNKKRKISHQKSRTLKNSGFHSASGSSVGELKQSDSKHSQTEEPAVIAQNPSNADHLQRMRKNDQHVEMSSEAGSDFSMFEALRDTIYSEVATLISQNESRPNFLIELFHELQLLNTDYLRQKALFALQDIATRRITDNKRDSMKTIESAGWMASNSELTPSESLATTDDEMYAKTSDCAGALGERNDGDNVSTLSTSSNFEPFATDDLGNTVIHLDQALARMREYERMKLEAENALAADSGSNINGAASNLEDAPKDGEIQNAQQSDEVSVPCPRIDTQQLDRQIKAIMKEVIPFLKEHMEEVCSPNLLTSIRRMVLTLTQQNDESKEFVKFFHKQLGSILQDSLAKFSSKKLKDCGEDLLVEISEVLFNELAFFRLMQDLDSSSIAAQGRSKRKSDAAGVLQSLTKEAQKLFDVEQCVATGDDEDKDKDETETVTKAQKRENIDGSEVQSGRSDISEEEDANDSLPVSISLSKAETQPLTNYGSGEDENEVEDNEEFEAGPVDVQTSLEASNDAAEDNEKDQVSRNTSEETLKCDKTEILANYTGLVEAEEEDSVTSAVPDISSPLLLNKEKDEVLSASMTENAKPPLTSSDSSGAESPATESPVLVECENGSGNTSQKSDEDDFVKVDDLPLKLNIPKSNLMQEMEKEEEKNNLCEEILNLAEQGNVTVELAGDGLSLQDPENFHSA
ncbi:pericentriolar material 1 protein [Spea bombifrons]|uniref:pericentriolar material 1 protein n=1 Tax=Spea bombifrons TaxID=233779 RepID=UPI00234ADE6E|nr:pericentriolar material 1 protein [Spea bombifrons]